MGCDACGVDFILPDNFEVDCDIMTADCGVERLSGFLCDHVLATLDQTEIDAAIAAEKLKHLPLGNVTITNATGSPYRITCNREVPGKTTYTIAYSSASQSASNEVYLYWKKLYAVKLNFTLFWKACNGLYFINPEWADWVTAGSNPGDEPDAPLGIPVSFASIPIQVRDEANEICSWNVSWTFKLNDVLVGVELPGIDFYA